MRESIEKKLALIQLKCLTKSPEDKYIPLGIGKLIFLAHYSPELLPFDSLEQVIELSTQDATQSLSSGSLAVALLIRDLCTMKLLDPSELEDLDTSADVIYRNSIDAHTQKREYDLFTGLVGKGVYFLAARKWADAATIVRQLDTIKVETGNTCYWLDPVQGADRCDLGLAHGVPSIIAFLAECFRCEVESSLCRQLLNQAVPYLLTQQGNATTPYQFATGLNVATGETPAASRLAWCYGDLGVGVALWRAGEALDHEPWREVALEIVRNAGQISREQAGIFQSVRNQIWDTGFCHGTAGIAHIFHRFYQATARAEFQVSAEEWLNFTLQQMENDTLLYPLDIRRDEWEEHAGLLEGYSGVGMVLLSFLEPQKYRDWDRSFLTNIA